MADEPQVEEEKEVENTCTHCGRYIGPIFTCPFCGQKIKRHSRITRTKNAALVFAIVGLLCFHAYSTYYGNPSLEIKDMTETTNYATVEMRGVVTRAPIYYPGEDGRPGTIYFTVDDGTGEISVRAYPIPVVKEMLATGKIPGYGDRVNVSGNVYWYNAERGFILNSLDRLDIYRPAPFYMPVSEIANLDPDAMAGYYRVKTYGLVTSWTKYYSAVDITVSDENENEISIYIPNAVFDLTGVGDLGRLEVGMGLEVVGCLEYYDAGSYSKWEIIPVSSGDIKKFQPDLAVVSITTTPLAYPLNQQFKVDVTVINAGQLPIARATLTIKFDGVEKYTTEIGALAAGQSLLVSYDTQVSDGRDSLTIEAIVATTAPLADSNPTNDVAQIAGGS